jgi:hypothetical protein
VSNPPTDTEQIPPMRIRHGRVMHQVERRYDGLASLCTRPDKLGKPVPRAQGPEDWWTAERYWYPDCTRCPAGDTTDDSKGV